MILFVDARKSAEASITSIANLSDLNPTQIKMRNTRAIIAKIMTPARAYF